MIDNAGIRLSRLRCYRLSMRPAIGKAEQRDLAWAGQLCFHLISSWWLSNGHHATGSRIDVIQLFVPYEVSTSFWNVTREPFLNPMRTVAHELSFYFWDNTLKGLRDFLLAYGRMGFPVLMDKILLFFVMIVIFVTRVKPNVLETAVIRKFQTCLKQDAV